MEREERGRTDRLVGLEPQPALSCFGSAELGAPAQPTPWLACLPRRLPARCGACSAVQSCARAGQKPGLGLGLRGLGIGFEDVLFVFVFVSRYF